MDRKVEQILKKVSVKLSLVDDLEYQLNFLEQAIDDTRVSVVDANEQADKIVDDIFEWSGYKIIVEDNEVEGIQSEYRQELQNFEDKANELGVDPSTLFSGYDKFKELLNVNINDVINSEKNENYNKLENL